MSESTTHLRLSFFAAIVPFVVSRLLIFLIIFLASNTVLSSGKLKNSSDTIIHPVLNISNLSLALDNVSQVVMSADAKWYSQIAKSGYTKERFNTEHQHNWAFFPLLPIAWKALAGFLGSFTLVGLLLSNLSFLLALFLLHRLCLQYNLSKEKADTTLWLISFYPASYFLSVPMTESLFLLLTTASFLLLTKQHPVFASLCFALATATRPTASFLLPAFLLELTQYKLRLSWRQLIAVVISPLGVILFSLYLKYLTGNPLAWVDIQVAWDRPGSIDGALKAFNPRLLINDWNFILLNFCALCLVIWGTLISLQKRHYVFAAYLAIPTLIAVSTGSLLSLSRFTLVLFPLFTNISSQITSSSTQKAVLLTFAALMSILSLLFSLHVSAAMC